MTKPVAIIAGEPNSISSEIIFKAWKLRKLYKHKPFFVIGNFQLLSLQKKKLEFRLKIKKISNNLHIEKLNKSKLSILDVEYKQKKSFEKLSNKSNNYKYTANISNFKNNKKTGLIGINFDTKNNHFKFKFEGPEFKKDMEYYYILMQEYLGESITFFIILYGLMSP